MKITALFLVLFFYFSPCSNAQEKPIVLDNTSLEDLPRAGKTNGYAVRRWYDCNPPGQTFVDIQPGFFTVEKTPSDGLSYVGMICREDGTWEGISQKLSRSLMEGQTYVLSIDLARAPTYLSQSNHTGQEENFANPVVLRIIGANEYCQRRELLAVSPKIEHEDWKTYVFEMNPKSAYEVITIEAYYISNVKEAYNGNLLIDNISAIHPIKEAQEAKLALGIGINTSSANLSFGNPVPAAKYYVPEKPQTKTEAELKMEEHWRLTREARVEELKRTKAIAEARILKEQKQKKEAVNTEKEISFTNKFLSDYELLQSVDILALPKEFKETVGNIYEYCEVGQARSIAHLYKSSSPKKMRALARSLRAIEQFDASVALFDLADAKELPKGESNELASPILEDDTWQAQLNPDLLIEKLETFVVEQKK